MSGSVLAWAGATAAVGVGLTLYWLSRPVRTGQSGELRLHAVVPEVYLWRGYFSNAAALVLGDQVLVVDTLVSPETAARMRRDLGRATTKPVGCVILTHFHGDHVGGTSVFADVARIASGRTAACLQSRDGEREAYARNFGLITHGVPEVLPPTRTFEGDSLDLQLGGEHLQVLHLGAAETADACAVWWPRRRVLACGDSLATAGFPFTGAPISDEGLQDDGQWLACLQRIRDLEPEVLLPGHGPPLVGRDCIAARIDRVSQLFREVLDTVRQQRQAGGDADAVVARSLRRLGHWHGQPDLRQNAISLRMTVLRAYHAVSPERRGRGWWSDLGPRTLEPADPQRAATALARLPTRPAVLAHARRLMRRQPGHARDLLGAAAAREPAHAAHFFGLCAWWLVGVAQRVATAYEGSDALCAAGQSAAQALALDPDEPHANLAQGVLEVLSAIMLGQPMQRGMGHLHKALACTSLGPAERAAARFFIGKAHQFEERDADADRWLRSAMPVWSRLLYPLFREKLRAIP